MKRSGLNLLAFSTLGAFALAVLLVAQQPTTPLPPPPIFTADQAQAGRSVYDQNCAGCHGANFQGSGDAPALAGGTFMLHWRPKMVSELFGEIIQTMPPTSPGSLGEAAGLNVTAYILQRNGALAGQRPLVAGAAMQIGSVANGQAQQADAAAGGRGAGGEKAGVDKSGAGGHGDGTDELSAGTMVHAGPTFASWGRGRWGVRSWLIVALVQCDSHRNCVQGSGIRGQGTSEEVKK